MCEVKRFHVTDMGNHHKEKANLDEAKSQSKAEKELSYRLDRPLQYQTLPDNLGGTVYSER